MIFLIFSNFGQNSIKLDFSALKVSRKLTFESKILFSYNQFSKAFSRKILQRFCFILVDIFLEWPNLALLEVNWVNSLIQKNFGAVVDM